MTVQEMYLAQIEQELKQTPVEYLPALLKIIQNFREIAVTNMKEINELKCLLIKALDKLYEKDNRLILRSVHERSIVFRFGIYFEEVIKNSSFNYLNVDAEYNKNGNNIKSLATRQHGTQPDILLHQRESNDNNKLIIEFKYAKNTQENISADIEKLKNFTSKDGEYKYMLGAFVLFERHNTYKIIYFINGQEWIEL